MDRHKFSVQRMHVHWVVFAPAEPMRTNIRFRIFRTWREAYDYALARAEAR